jgi:hypothetical protein
MATAAGSEDLPARGVPVLGRRLADSSARDDRRILTLLKATLERPTEHGPTCGSRGSRFVEFPVAQRVDVSLTEPRGAA